MNVFSTITSATRAALLYITVGSVTIVWSGIYYVYLENHPPAGGGDSPWYWCTGFLLTGVTLLIIGLTVGWIGRTARQAEQPHAMINTTDNRGNPMQDVVPLANNAVIPPATNVAPATAPINPARQQPVVPAQPPQTISRS